MGGLSKVTPSPFYRDPHLDLGQEASKSAKYKLHFLLCLAHVLRGLTAGLPRWGDVTAPLAAVLCCLAAGIRFPSAAMRPVGRCVHLPSEAIQTPALQHAVTSSLASQNLCSRRQPAP